MSEVLAGITGPFSVGLSEWPAWAFSHGSGVPSGSKQQRAGLSRLDLELARHCSHPLSGKAGQSPLKFKGQGNTFCVFKGRIAEVFVATAVLPQSA